ncbi:S1 family peptidase [Spirillospora sp. CA-294931]|uniref:S1 family peptidase n=1 Tax=Spirillospora sp. CA-294931 TaxID=3240042 RepID=UPI003D912318
MKTRFTGAALAALAAGALLTATGSAAEAAAPPVPVKQQQAKAVDFTAIVALSNCSGSLVRGPKSADTDRALVMTNGHCLESGMPGPGQVIVDKASSRTFKLLNKSGSSTLGTLRATQVEYGTMTDTDVAIYKLDTTYAAIRSRYATEALKLSTAHPTAGNAISVVSGYWKRIYNCKIDGFVYRLREANWTWKDSIRYTPECDTIGGTSGSPVIDQASGQVVGVNNTGNNDGERCTLNNPCEVDEAGNVTVRHNINYGQQTYLLAQCLGAGNDVVLGGTCALPRPRR